MKYFAESCVIDVMFLSEILNSCCRAKFLFITSTQTCTARWKICNTPNK